MGKHRMLSAWNCSQQTNLLFRSLFNLVSRSLPQRGLEKGQGSTAFEVTWGLSVGHYGDFLQTSRTCKVSWGRDAARARGTRCSAGRERVEGGRDTTWCHLTHSPFYMANGNQWFPVLEPGLVLARSVWRSPTQTWRQMTNRAPRSSL